MKKIVYLEIKPIRLYLELIFYSIKPLAGLFILIKSCETIALMSQTWRIGFIVW
jgi:hypothetical protein